MKLVLPLGIALTFSICAYAEEIGNAESEDLLAGHSKHGEVFNEGPRQQAYLMSGTGKIEFDVTTDVPTVQKFVEQGIGQLHGFWFLSLIHI